MIQGVLGILAMICNALGLLSFESIVDKIGFGVSMFLLIPNIAATARRMHDIGRSGWTQLISFIPVVGFFVFLTYELRRGDQGENAYGERTGYIPVTSDISKETGLEETPSRRQDWIMGITIFLIQSIQIADVVGELLWFGLNGNGYM
jgi:conserved domain protein